MTAAAPPRTGRTTGPRRGRHTQPAWAESYPDTAEGMDATMTAGEARRLPLSTDPDTIEDPDVREAFLARLQADEEDGGSDEHSDPQRSGRAPGRRAPAAPARGGRSKTGRSSSSGLRPTLRPPSRLSASDGTGFALGLLLTTVGLNYLRYGKAGVKAWILAKFLNKPDTLADQQANERSYKQGLRDTHHLLLDPLKPGKGHRMDKPPIGFPPAGGAG